MSATERASFIHDPNLKVLIDTDRLQARVRAMAEQITSDYAGKNLHLIGVLKGACVFLSDLMRSIDLPLHWNLELRRVDKIIGRSADYQGPRREPRRQRRACG